MSSLPLSGEDAGVIVRATVLDLEGAEPAWRHLEATGIATPNHRYEWMAAWQRHIGASDGIEPAVVVGYDAAGQPVLVWPLGVRQALGVRIASWLGGRFANYQMGLYARSLVARPDLNAVTRCLAALRDERKVDALSLINQPYSWGGQRNPLLELPHQPAPSSAYSLEIDGRSFEDLYAALRSGPTRKKLRRSERKITEDCGSCTIMQPSTHEEVDALIDVFMHQKRLRMAESGAPNVFERQGVDDFLRDLGHRSLGTVHPLLDIYWLQAGDRVAATWAGVNDGKRLSGLMNSFDPALAANHPGEIVLRDVIELACRKGLKGFDLGTGDATYKLSWCPTVDELFETHLALSTRGLPVSCSEAVFTFAKRHIKRSDGAMALLHRLGIA
ncbi:GNAT family N-acetyltransferase [Lutibaculum baratangense]|uniref:GNAT family N-acetyltransferase n=1 Tax=Lutibaculum baratangense TaxID=1358440 RepID=UPI001362F3FA|nr:GNAT family N-acetyltransferase [Lutibaculum baratangense]